MFFLSALLSPALAAPEPMKETPDEAVYKMVEGLTLAPTLKVTSTGKGKRRLLKFTPKSGKTTAYDTITTQSMVITLEGPDGEKMELPGLGELTPTITASMQNTIGERTKNGLYPVQVDYLNTTVTGVPPELQKQLEATMGSMIGFRMLVNGKTGRVEQVDVDSSDQMMFEMMQSVVDTAVTQMPSFPSKSVGVGATWTLDVDMNLGGMNLIAHQDVELTAVDATTAELAYTITMDRGEGDMAIPGLPPGATADFTSFHGTGSGTQTIDLTTLSSVGSSTFDVKLDMTFAAEDKPSMKMGLSMTQSVETQLSK